MAKKARLIINPIAGKGKKSAFVSILKTELARADFELAVFETSKKGDARAFAASDECEDCLVIAAGGDGTISEVVQGMNLETSKLGILPLGTANVMALELGLRRNPSAMLKCFADGRERLWDVGVANGRKFLVFLGAAFDAAVTGALSQQRKGNITYLTYVIPTLRTYASWRPPRIRVSIDGRQLDGEACQVIISNVNHFARFFRLWPEVSPDDGLLDVFILKGKGKLALLKYGGAMFFRLLPLVKRAEHYRAREIVLDSQDPGVPYQLDGDLAGTLPVKISVLPQALRIVV